MEDDVTKLFMPEHMAAAFMEGYDPNVKTDFQVLAEKMITELARMPEEQRRQVLADMKRQINEM